MLISFLLQRRATMTTTHFSKYDASCTSHQISNNSNTSNTIVLHARPFSLDRTDYWNVHVWKKRCKNILWLYIFILYMAGMLGTLVYALRHGNIYRLFYPTDSFGNICGRDNEHIMIPIKYRKDIWLQKYVGQDMSHRKFSFLFDATQKNNSLKICVQKCPDEDVEAINVVEFHRRTKNAFCMPNRKDNGHEKFCPIGPIYKSTEKLMMCVPEVSSLSEMSSSHELGMLFNSIYMLLQYFIADLVTIQHDILPFCGFSLGLAILMGFILQFFSSALICFLFISITFISVGFGSFCWYYWYLYYLNVRNDTKTKGEHPLNMTCYLLLILLAAVSLAVLVILTMMWCAFPRSKQLKKFFHKAGKILRSNIFLAILPVTTSFLTFFIYATCIIISLLLFSTAPGKLIRKTTPDGTKISTLVTENTQTIHCLWWYLVVGTIWLTEFTYACHRYIMARTIILWYQNRTVPCCSAFGNMIRFHVGSLAFGSFLIATFRMPRSILLWINTKLKSWGKCGKPLFCLISVLNCLERPIKHLHESAYTIIALKEQDFCHSARIGMSLLLENASDVAQIYCRSTAVICITKALVAVIVAVSAGFWFHYRYQLNAAFLVVFSVGQLAYMIAARFLHVYEVIIETLFLCNILSPFFGDHRRK